MLRRFLFSLTACAVAVLAVLSAQADDVADRLENQRAVQAETDYTVRRLQTLIRVLDFFQADETAQKKAMDEMVQVLSGLSQDQMREVISRLEAAAKAGQANLAPDQDQAVWAKHREILDTLKDMIGRYDAVQNLDQAAERFDKIATAQFDLHLAAGHVSRAKAELGDPDLKGADRLAVDLRVKAGRNFDGVRLWEQQKDMQKDVLLLMQQILKLEKKLSPEHKRRFDNMTEYSSETKVVAKLVESIVKLNPTGTADARARSAAQAIELQDELAHRYACMAHLLRLPSDDLTLLKNVRGKVADAVARQTEILDVTTALTESSDKKEIATRSRESFDKQAWTQFHSWVAEQMTSKVADDVATLLGEAQIEMKTARAALVKSAPADAVAPETAAKDKLFAALEEIDRRIERLELLKRDPVAALENFLERLDRLIKNQTELRDKTTDGAADAKALSKSQRELAAENDKLLDLPIPSKDKVEPLLYKAASAMSGAVKELDANAAKAAVPQQDRALAALKEARELLVDKLNVAKADRDLLRPDREPPPNAKEAQEAKERQAANEAELSKGIDVARAADQVKAALERTSKARETTAPPNPKKEETIAVAPKKVDPNEPKETDPKDPKIAKLDPKGDGKQPDPKTIEPKLEKIAVEPKKNDDWQKTDPKIAKNDQKPADPKMGDPKPGDLKIARNDPKDDQKPGDPKMGDPKPGDPKVAKNDPKGDPKSGDQKSAKADQKGDGKQHGKKGDPLADAKQNTRDAEALLAQARSQAPPTVQGPLDDAAKKLADAKNQLDNANPADADRALAQAEKDLKSALDTLNGVQQAMGPPPMGDPMKMQAKADPKGDPGEGDKPGPQGKQPGTKPGDGKDPGKDPGKQPGTGKGPERNETPGNGDRKADGQVANAPSKLLDVDGPSSFLHLQQRQRDLITQSLSGNLPPEYAHSIQQYYMNVARGRPAGTNR